MTRHFRKGLWAKKKYTSPLHENNGDIRSQFCIYHDSWALVTCANLWPGYTIKTKNTTNLFSRDFDYKDIIPLWNVFLVSQTAKQSAATRAPFQYPIRRLIVRSREVSKSQDLYLELSDRFDIGQAPRQHCCRPACQMSKRCDNLNCQSRGFETSRDLMIKRLIGYWNGSRW